MDIRKKLTITSTDQIEAYKRAFPGTKVNLAYPLAAIYACRGDKAKAYEYLKIFNQNPDCTLLSLARLNVILCSIVSE